MKLSASPLMVVLFSTTLIPLFALIGCQNEKPEIEIGGDNTQANIGIDTEATDNPDTSIGTDVEDETDEQPDKDSETVVPGCANGVLESDEACDDGNSQSGDGCAEDCETIEDGYICPRGGLPCVALAECGNGVLERGETCDDGNTKSGDGCTGGTIISEEPCQTEAGFVCLSAGQACVALVCGDGNRTPDEECDDGNGKSGDGCSSACDVEDGWRCVASGCATICGDGRLDGAEDCDDGNGKSGDGCSSACRVEPFFDCTGTPSTCSSTIVCGDGQVDPGEICDPPGVDGCLDGCTSFSSDIEIEPVCGNGLIEENEECDDGNSKSGDGCLGTEVDVPVSCRVEPGYYCPYPNQACVPLICGDGNRTPNEDCDDGNGKSGDGCSSTCDVEDGWRCSSSGCATICGDGRVDGAEECDDGNGKSGDGCSSACREEPFFECIGAPSDCSSTIVCGDGRVDPGEICDPPGVDGCLDGCKSFAPDTSDPPECGNNIIEVGETCDPPAVGSGCSDTCQTEDGYACPRPGTCIKTPECGDGVVQVGEQCDVGAASDPGCVACEVTDGYVCFGSAPSTCVVLVHERCGDGMLAAGEECDDENTDNDDGCNSACAIEEGWECPEVGEPCEAICGDGLLLGDEECDDGDTDPGDGCSASCEREEGYACPEGDADCHLTSCGDGVKEGDEPCDDGNQVVGDGCSPFCELEPTCSPGGPCISSCGDGMILPGDNEECDDGNTLDGDGCSSTCEIEEGFECTTISGELPDVLEVPATFRDFVALPQNGSTRHPDFEVYSGSAATLGLVEAVLGGDGKPIYTGLCEAGSPNLGNHNICPYGVQTTSESVYNQWYRDVDGINITRVKKLSLDRQPDGTYFFPDSAFFPLDNDGWVAQNLEKTAVGHNFGFSSEIRTWFEFKGGEYLAFSGDDDVWVFIAGQLALDLGGMHPQRSGNFTLDQATADSLGLEEGKLYEIALFHAERHSTGSNFNLTLGGFVSAHSECAAICGDGIVVGDEECDDGSNDGSYGSCLPDCSNRGPRCGDGVIQGDHEDCDDGLNVTVRENDVPSACAPGCIPPTSCGDGVVQPAFEACDNGDDNSDTAYGLSACTASCNFGAFCGDGVTNGPEACDNGESNGVEYGPTSCGYDCQPGPRCGDGVRNGSEECDGTEHCQEDCTLEPYCGDGVASDGEECDYGQFASFAYGSCTDECEFAPHCGDGNLDALYEECDLGADSNGGGYGGCNADCTLASRCGDGILDGDAGEQCDNGTNNDLYTESSDACGPGCVLPPRCGDGVVNHPAGEECDNGDLNGKEYGDLSCSLECLPGPHCGDGIRNGAEECDGTEHCAEDCTFAPYCGDGVISEGEDCDYGQFASDTYGGCTDECEAGPHCGDGNLDAPYEECDLGAENNIGGYDGCNANCTLGSRCGDGVKDSDAGEECDNGFNDDEYALGDDSCAAGCKLPPGCGDGVVDPAFEQCDNGADNADDTYEGCTTNCSFGPYCGDDSVQPQHGEECDDGPTGSRLCTPDCRMLLL